MTQLRSPESELSLPPLSIETDMQKYYFGWMNSNTINYPHLTERHR